MFAFQGREKQRAGIVGKMAQQGEAAQMNAGP